jgi:hypothetical protein
LVDFTPLNLTIDATAFQESKETQGANSARDTMMLTDGALVHDAARPDSAAATGHFLAHKVLISARDLLRLWNLLQPPFSFVLRLICI